mmetsp:Transcript_10509/g.25473  ORF Transcript_10509/g.25473 Transcript_10509/m.25473 type:complete len:227 (-) Transcript_10509:116-796(-)
MNHHNGVLKALGQFHHILESLECSVAVVDTDEELDRPWVIAIEPLLGNVPHERRSILDHNRRRAGVPHRVVSRRTDAVVNLAALPTVEADHNEVRHGLVCRVHQLLFDAVLGSFCGPLELVSRRGKRSDEAVFHLRQEDRLLHGAGKICLALIIDMSHNHPILAFGHRVLHDEVDSLVRGLRAVDPHKECEGLLAALIHYQGGEVGVEVLDGPRTGAHFGHHRRHG